MILIDDDIDELDFLSVSLTNTQKVAVLAVCLDFESLITALDTGLKPDIIVCDIQMPKKSGLDICLSLRALPPYKDTPVVLMSSTYPAKPIAEKATSLGVKSIQVKPETLGGYDELAATLLAICTGANP